jgi:RNA polymerase sigma-70 factor (ECF subfamily)
MEFRFFSESTRYVASKSEQQTSITLLARLRHNPADEAAWADFVHRYGGHIYHWCRQWKLQEADAQDVTQAVLVKLSQKMRTFRPDPAKSFRAYLKTLTHYAWQDFIDSRRRTVVGSGDSSIVEALETIEARDDLVERLNGEFDHELLEQGANMVQERVERHTWEAFRLTALEGLSGREAAQRLRLTVATVFKAKSKVRKMLQEEIRRLEEQ